MRVDEFATLGGERWVGAGCGVVAESDGCKPDPVSIVAELHERGGPVREQQVRFMAATGLQQRMYFYYRDRLALPKQTHKSKSRDLEESLRQ